MDGVSPTPSDARTTLHDMSPTEPGARIDPSAAGLDPRADGRARCWWSVDALATADPLMVDYHDAEWGVPVGDDVALFERLVLESFQAGLAWVTILRKREAFRTAFRGFDPAIVASFADADRARLMADAAIVRNGAKIDATIANAAAFLDVVRETGSFAAYLAPFGGGVARRLPPGAMLADVPARTAASDALSADLKRRGFRFVGSTIVYAFMQSVGLVDDHLPGCFRYGSIGPEGVPP
jgi:DNA-3-methyladenine glycosylase I